jgi:hypothetical protein
MEKLYRLVGAAGFSFTVFGVRIGVRVDDRGLLARIRCCLPPEWGLTKSHTVDILYSFIGGQGAQPGIRHFRLLYRNIQNLARTADEDELLEMFESDMNIRIAQAARSRFFVHAGVVGWNGQAIVIPGPSYSGKTTLVKEFLDHGATYYSDEFAVLDRRGYVHPFARALGIRQEISQKQIKVSAADLGAKTGVGSLPVGLLLFTHFQGATRWRPRTLSAGNGALKLLANALSAREQPGRAFVFLERAVHRARILSGKRGEAKDVVQSSLAALQGRS